MKVNGVRNPKIEQYFCLQKFLWIFTFFSSKQFVTSITLNQKGTNYLFEVILFYYLNCRPTFESKIFSIEIFSAFFHFLLRTFYFGYSYIINRISTLI